jgi:hypothetical protein
MSADPAVLEYAEPKRPLAIPSQPTEGTRRQMPPPDGFVAKPINPEKVLDLARKLTSVPRQAG